MDAVDFFLGPLTTALAPDELIVDVHLPPWPSGRRWGFQEFFRRRGDFAMAGVALFYDEQAGCAANAHISIIGTNDRPQRLSGAEAVLNRRAVDGETIGLVAASAAAEVEMHDDMHASAAYRTALVGTLVERALGHAAAIDPAERE